jgi:hypothetical protein
MNYLPRLALNRNPPDLCLQDYRSEPLAPGPKIHFFIWHLTKSVLPIYHSMLVTKTSQNFPMASASPTGHNEYIFDEQIIKVHFDISGEDDYYMLRC